MEANYFTILYWFCHAAAKLLQSGPTLCDPIDGSPPGSSVPGILQARTPEWVAVSSSNAWKWKVKVKSFSHVRLLVTPWTAAHQAPPSPYIDMNPPRVYMCSPSWTPFPPPSPYHPSGSSQCTSPKHPVSCIEPRHGGNQNWKRHMYPNVHRSTVLPLSGQQWPRVWERELSTAPWDWWSRETWKLASQHGHHCSHLGHQPSWGETSSVNFRSQGQWQRAEE